MKKTGLISLILFLAASPAFCLTESERIMRQTVLYTAGDNYINNVFSPEGEIIRWNKAYFPIKVYIENNPSVPLYYSDACMKAVIAWQLALRDTLKMNITPDEKEANIVFKVIKTPKTSSKGDTTEIAYTTSLTKGDTLVKESIYIYDRLNGKFIPQKQLLAATKHEFGHALGIQGHSDKNKSIMNPFVSDDSGTIANIDINTMKLLYKLQPDITNGSKNLESGNIDSNIILGSNEERINEAIRAQKQENLTIKDTNSYAKLATSYFQKSDYEKMLFYTKKAKEAAKSDSDYVTFNVLYLNYYYAKKDKANALKYYNEALKYASESKLNELRTFKKYIDKL